MRKMVMEYLEAAQKLEPIIKKYRDLALSAPSPDAAAVARLEYSRLCDIRRDLLDIASYLEGYHVRKFAYSKKENFFSDYFCFEKRRKRSLYGELL